MNILDQDFDTIIELLEATDCKLQDIVAEYKEIKLSDRIPAQQKALQFWVAMESALNEAECLLNDGSDEPNAEYEAEKAEYFQRFDDEIDGELQ